MEKLEHPKERRVFLHSLDVLLVFRVFVEGCLRFSALVLHGTRILLQRGTDEEAKHRSQTQKKNHRDPDDYTPRAHTPTDYDPLGVRPTARGGWVILIH